MGIRTYVASADEVVRHIGGDRDAVHSLAYIYDALKLWENPDERDYQTPLKKTPQMHFSEGRLMGNKYELGPYREHFAAEVFSHQIRQKQNLKDLAGMYRRLRLSPVKEDIPDTVLDNILLKMLWLSSGRGSARAA